MKIRAISIVVLITFVSLLLHSCTEDASVNPASREDEEIRLEDIGGDYCVRFSPTHTETVNDAATESGSIAIPDPGELHNAVLAKFAERHDMLGAERMSADEYIELIVASTNTALREHGIEASVSRDDALRAIRELYLHGRNGGYDFFSQRNDPPVRMFGYLEESLNADPRQMDLYLRAVRSAREKFKEDIGRSRNDDRGTGFQIVDEEGLSDPFVDKVFISTYSFWTDLVAEELDGVDLGLDFLDFIDDKYFPFEPDIMATVLAIVVGLPVVLSILYPIIASTICYVAPPSWSDYNYHTR